jgi:DNA-binding GntR family transcriptional regulator
MSRMASKAGQRVPGTKQQQVYEAIRERILSGAYGAGYRVVIDAIAEEFGMSALPVREAIRRLEAEGLVIFRPNMGAQVAPADPGLFEEDMEVLAVLEGYATALAKDHLSAEDLDELRRVNDDMATAMQNMDSLTFGKLNQDFHRLIYQRCPNVSLVRLLEDVARRLDAIRRTVFVQIPYRGASSIEEHSKLIALLASDASATEVEKAARAHKLNTVKVFTERRTQAESGETAPAVRT